MFLRFCQICLGNRHPASNCFMAAAFNNFCLRPTKIQVKKSQCVWVLARELIGDGWWMMKIFPRFFLFVLMNSFHPNKNPSIFLFKKWHCDNRSFWEGDLKQWKKSGSQLRGGFFYGQPRSVDVEWLLLLSIVNEAFLFVHLHQVRFGFWAKPNLLDESFANTWLEKYTCWDLYWMYKSLTCWYSHLGHVLIITHTHTHRNGYRYAFTSYLGRSVEWRLLGTHGWLDDRIQLGMGIDSKAEW